MPLAGGIIRAGDVPGDPIAYTPVITGATSGTWVAGATVINAFYIRAGDWIETWVDLALGAGVSITGSIATQTLAFSLPVAAHASIITPMPIGTGMILDTGTGGYPCHAMLQNANTFFFRYTGAAGTAVTMQSNTFTFASTDRIGWNVRYIAA